MCVTTPRICLEFRLVHSLYREVEQNLEMKNWLPFSPLVQSKLNWPCPIKTEVEYELEWQEEEFTEFNKKQQQVMACSYTLP